MTDYVWYPVTGSGTSGSPYVWNTGLFNWNSGSFWADANELILGAPTVIAGTVPGSGTGTSQGAGNDSVGLVAGEISTTALAGYNFIAPSHGDPIIASNDYKVDLQINTGTVDLQNLLLASAYSSGISDIHEYPTLDVEGASLKIEGSIANSVTVVFPVIGTQSASGGGTIELGGGGTIAVAGSVLPGIVMTFKDGANDLLTLGGVSSSQTAEFAGTIAGFGTGDTIDLPSVAFSNANIENFDTATGILTISNGATTLATLQMAGTYTTTSFLLHADGAGDTAIVTCFVAGTRIRTLHGEAAVETLREGDRVPTMIRNGAAPIKWIGRRRVDCRRHPRPELVWPVRIAAGAFSEGTPARDLLVSPDHAVFVDGVLIPVKYLIDGRTIAQVAVDDVTYYHLELPDHDVLIAEGLPVESYLDTGNRSAFDSTDGGVVTAYPDFSIRVWEATGCARLVVTGPELEAVRRRLRDRAARFAAAA